MEKIFVMANPQPEEFEFECSKKLCKTWVEYKELFVKETEIGHKLFDFIRTSTISGTFPNLILETRDILLSGNSISAIELHKRVEEIVPVIKRVLSMMADGLHLQIIKGMLSWSIGGACIYGNHPSERFLSLYDKKEREAFWGTQWELPLQLVMGMILDFEQGLDINTPLTREEFKRSQIINVARKYGCSEAAIEKACASYTVYPEECV